MEVRVNNKLDNQKSVNISDDFRMDEQGRFQIINYDRKPAFASFLPGVGGPDGVPLWCLYVNRGQGICSFGVGNKDNAVVEFLPANWAYQLTGTQGFRTFCKIGGKYYEPFQNTIDSKQFQLQRSMWIEMDRLILQEINSTIGLRFDVTYFSPVNKSIGSLVRMLSVTNISSQKIRLDGLDGLPLILPAGFTDIGIKTMRRIHEAYASVRLVAGHVPFYAAKVMTHDEAEVEEVRKGNFYATWQSVGNQLSPIEPYYDSDLIFGASQDLITPRNFIEQVVLDRYQQVSENKLPCALSPFSVSLEANETATMVSLSGMAPSDSMLKTFILDFKTLADFEQVSRQSRELVESLTRPAFMVSSQPQLDAYARQNYLDNILRGGIPFMLSSKSGPTLLHLYSRRHGDAERDYNFFDLPACPLSSGEGNYRDICQNRRNDVWFYPVVMDQEIRMFVSLIQADGYNPLSIKGYLWYLDEQTDPMQWCPAINPEARTTFRKLVTDCFLPGELLGWVNYYKIGIPNQSEWLRDILSHCDVKLIASGHEGGYWVDHWTYIVDLMEAFDAVYPDQTQQMLTSAADIKWFFEPAHVLDRKRKYIRRKNGPLQLDAVIDAPDQAVELPPTTILGKLCALIAVKAVSLDYEGCGIEMEAGRPGWNDAMNGLPGLFGSSVSETVETLRLAKWLMKVLPEMPDTGLPVEVAKLVADVNKELKKEYDWDRSSKIRESFRKRIYDNHSKKKASVVGSDLQQLLQGVIPRFENGINQAIDPNSGLLHTYYYHQPLDSKDRKDKFHIDGSTYVDIGRFESNPLPLFLEGQVHWLRVCSADRASRIYKAVRQSPLLDQQLQMYKLNECLEGCSPEIGRARTFSRGWFENESIWLHMSTKYLLELIKQEFYEEFYVDAETMLVPFMDPKIYGRSITENSSFIASSTCPDPAARGRGFVARLSGTTAEFIHIWLLLTIGKQPFKLQDGQLCFNVQPALPATWFTEKEVKVQWGSQKISIPENAFACALLGDILLVYHNPDRRNTYGKNAVQPVKYCLNGQQEIRASEIVGRLAEQIRRHNFNRIDVWLK